MQGWAWFGSTAPALRGGAVGSTAPALRGGAGRALAGACVHAAAVASLGVLAAAATYAASEFFAFLGQVLHLAGSDDRWRGGLPLLSAADLPGAGVIVAGAVLGLALQSACCAAGVLAYRRTRALLPAVDSGAPGGTRSVAAHAWLAWAAIVLSALALLAQVAGALYATSHALARVHAGGSAAAAEQLAGTVLADGYRGLVIHPLAAIVFALPQGMLALAACAYAATALQHRSAARRARGMADDDPAAHAWRAMPCAPVPALLASAAVLLVLGLLPFAGASLWYFGSLHRAFEVLTRMDPVDRTPTLIAALDAAPPVLAHWTRIAIAGIALASALAVVVVVVLPLRRRMALSAGAPAPVAVQPGVAPALVAVAALCASTALVQLTAPYRAENALPMHAGRGEAYLVPGVPVPVYDGPDERDVAPVLESHDERVLLDQSPVHDLGALQADLETTRRNWSILHPHEPALSALRWQCVRRARLAVAIPALYAAHKAGFTHVRMVVGRWVTTRRPLLGVLERPQFSAAAAELTTRASAAPAQPSANPNSTTLVLDPQRSCDTLARDLVALRNAGRYVRLQLP